MNSFDIRTTFLKYFKQNGHTVVGSSPLIPAEDPTLLFTNAGMNQFKDLFLGNEQRSYKRAATSQKCVRAGGKHNDLDEVGFTARHLTFFEMLGNFSFGDYFKQEAIHFAWELLTKGYNLPAEKLYITVFETDDESYNIWHKKIGVPKEHIYRLGESDNFWAMGETGPCGPCTEIYYDLGPEEQGDYSHASPGSESPRYVEIWNLVFMQYNRASDGTMEPLKQTGVDTGMGLERLSMVMQGKKNVYQTDLFTSLIHHIEKLSATSYAAADNQLKAAFHVLSDHVRSTTLLIADGGAPSNEGRGYVLRKIIRRAALFMQKITNDLTIFKNLALYYIELMSPIFPELATNKSLILAVLESEIERFGSNLIQGQNILGRYIDDLKTQKHTIVDGDQVFKLYDTYGFPVELTRIIAQEKGFDVDLAGFENAMKHQQQQSGKKKREDSDNLIVSGEISTTFVGYEKLESTSSILFVSMEKDHAWIITEESPFYVECGGQVNDDGWVTINQQTFSVIDLKKTGDVHHPAIAVKISLKGKTNPSIAIGDKAHSVVNDKQRINTVRNHTATHMLQAALIETLGKQVKQAGSLVCSDYLRFDFSHHEALSNEQIQQIESIVNEKVYACIETKVTYSSLQESKDAGVISFFGEKYNPEKVRIVTIPGFSSELCGGTHAHNTGIIGAFKIISETSLATGTRRIFAVTGPEAIKLFQQTHDISKRLSERFKVKIDGILDAVDRQQDQMQITQTAIRHLKKQVALSRIPELIDQIEDVHNIPFLFAQLDGLGVEDLRPLCQELEKHKPGLYWLSVPKEKGVGFLCYQSDSNEKKIDLKQLASWLKEKHELRGGGNSKSIQGSGSKTPSSLRHEIIKKVKELS